MEIKSLVRHGAPAGTFVGHYNGILPEIGSAVETAVYGELTGYLVGRYNETLKTTPVPIPLVAGLGLKATAVIADAFLMGRGHDPSFLTRRLHALGNTGMTAFFVLDGVARGYEAAGQQLQSGAKGGALPAGAKKVDRLWGEPAATNVGEIPLTDGQYLDDQGLRHFGSRGQRQ